MKKYLQFIKTIFINILFLYIMLYFLEIYFQIKSKNLFKETSYYKFKELTSKQKLMPMIRPTHLKDIHSNIIVPVSLVSNVKTLLCMDGDEPIYFKSDINGFDNENLDIGDEVDIVLLGDSFAAGLLHALHSKSYSSPELAIRFAVAASCLKHSIQGDFNYVSESEVAALISGNVTGRVQR